MIVVSKKSFNKDIEKIRNKKLAQRIKEIIADFEKTAELKEIHNLKKIQGTRNAYRIRMGDYRMGFFVKDNIIELVVFAHRKDIYREFP